MTPELESRLAHEAQENCYTGENLHALRRGAEIALQWLPMKDAPAEGVEILGLCKNGDRHVVYGHNYMLNGKWAHEWAQLAGMESFELIGWQHLPPGEPE